MGISNSALLDFVRKLGGEITILTGGREIRRKIELSKMIQKDKIHNKGRNELFKYLDRRTAEETKIEKETTPTGKTWDCPCGKIRKYKIWELLSGDMHAMVDSSYISHT